MRPLRRPVDGPQRNRQRVGNPTRGGWALAAWAVAGLIAAEVVAIYVVGPVPLGIDAHAYWLAGRSAHPYAAAPGVPDAFLYSPVFVQLMHVLAQVPWPVFLGVWLVTEAAIFAWLVCPLPLVWAVPVWLVCLPEIALGNIVGLMCLAAVAGMSGYRAGVWAFGYLTKIVPGGLGTLWAVGRRDGQAVTSIMVVTGSLTLVSYVVAPGLWHQWLSFLLHFGGGTKGIWALARAGMAAVLVLVGARTSRPWLMVPALILATPVLAHVEVLAYLAALPRLMASAPGRLRRDPTAIGAC